jgi:heat shock protein HslJ
MTRCCLSLRVPRVLASLSLAVAATVTQPAFAQPTPGSMAPFKAVGHEPGWTLDIGGSRMVLILDSGATRAEMPLPAAVRIDGGRRYEARTDAHAVVVTILDRTCADTMTGMPRPSTVEVSLDGRTLRGCGGDPTSILRGGLWFVEQLRGGPIVEMSRMTMQFGANGRVSGTASCNTYSAGYVLSGEGVTMTMPIASMRTCEAPYMAQEAEFLELLRGVNRFELREDGQLVLHTADGGTIAARRQAPTVVAPKKPAKPR